MKQSVIIQKNGEESIFFNTTNNNLMVFNCSRWALMDL